MKRRSRWWDSLFGVQCVACGARNEVCCARCRSTLRVRMTPGGSALDALGVCAEYASWVRSAVLQAKYSGHTAILDVFAAVIAAGLRSAGGDGFDLVVHPPSAREHRARRGFDPGGILAAAVARNLNVAHRNGLRRSGGAQTGRSGSERRLGLEIVALTAAPPRVLVVDDVMTTGTTLACAARALRSAGARHVTGVVIAHRRLNHLTQQIHHAE